MSTFERTHERVNRLRVCALWMVFLEELLPGIAKTATGKHATSAKHMVDCDWTVSKCSDANAVLQTDVFFIPVVRNKKRLPGSNSKTSGCLSRIS